MPRKYKKDSYYYIMAGSNEFESKLKKTLEKDGWITSEDCIMKINFNTRLGKQIHKFMKEHFSHTHNTATTTLKRRR